MQFIRRFSVTLKTAKYKCVKPFIVIKASTDRGFVLVYDNGVQKNKTDEFTLPGKTHRHIIFRQTDRQSYIPVYMKSVFEMVI